MLFDLTFYIPMHFQFEMPSDQQLIQRLFEIVATVDSGKYSGDQDQMVFEMEDEQASEDEIMMLMMAAAIASQNPSSSSFDLGRRSAAKKKTTPIPSTSKKENNNKLLQGMDAATLQQYMALVAAASVPQTGKSGSSNDVANQLAQLALMQMAMSPAMNSNTVATAKALEDALNLSKKESTPKPGSSSSKSSNVNQANAMAMFSAATEAAFEQAAIQQLGITLPELMLLQNMDPSKSTSFISTFSS